MAQRRSPPRPDPARSAPRRAAFARVDWDRAACAGEDTGRFYADTGPGTDRDISWCRALCAGCPVSGQCLDYAMEHEQFGIWGGTTAEERRRARKARSARNRKAAS